MRFSGAILILVKIMTQAAIKETIKQAISEGLHENRDSFRDLFAEVLEDLALCNAIREGEKTRRVAKSVVLKALRRQR